MGKRYNVNATIVITLDVITEFDDDEITELEDQARETAIESCDIPASLLCDAEIQDIAFEEIEQEKP